MKVKTNLNSNKFRNFDCDKRQADPRAANKIINSFIVI